MADQVPTSQIIADVQTLAAGMRGVVALADRLKDAEAVDNLAAEAQARLRDTEAKIADGDARLAAQADALVQGDRELQRIPTLLREARAQIDLERASMTAKADAYAADVIKRADDQAAASKAEALAARDALLEEIVARRKTIAMVDAEAIEKQKQLESLLAQIAAAKAAIASIAG